MKRRSFLLLTTVALACTRSSGPVQPKDKPEPTEVSSDAAVAYLAGGCFWGVEHYMEALPGVTEVVSGYMGGKVDNPTYKQVSYEHTGHLETVAVTFDPQTVSFREVAKLFFEIHDPTQADGQGPDIGDQYLSAVFYVDEGQKQVTEQLIAELRERDYDVVTQVRPAATFWPAEEYHQNYYARKGGTPYCHARVRRFGD